MDIERAVGDFVSKGEDLFHRLRAEGEAISDLALRILRTQLHILNVESVSLQHVYGDRDQDNPTSFQKPRARRPLQKKKRPDHCSLIRLIDDVVDANGNPTNLLCCLECEAITKDPAPKGTYH